jgi:hypothetical protein
MLLALMLTDMMLIVAAPATGRLTARGAKNRLTQPPTALPAMRKVFHETSSCLAAYSPTSFVGQS